MPPDRLSQTILSELDERGDYIQKMEQLLITRHEAAGSRVYFSPEELQAFVKKEGSLC